MKSIAIINQKGGVGKTACAYNLAYVLSLKKICTTLIDIDPSANATKGLGVTEFIYSSNDLLLKPGTANELHMMPYLTNENLFLVPSSIKLALAHRELINRPFRETILDKKIILQENHFYIIDCPPTLSDLTINAIYASTDIIIPVTYEEDALEGMADLFSVINEIKENQVFNFKILRSKKDSRKSRTNEYIENKLKAYILEGHVFNTIIRQDEAINQAKIERKPVFIYAPQSNGTKDYLQLSEEILHAKK